MKHTQKVASSSQILSHSCGESLSFLHSCEIKSGSGLGTRLHKKHISSCDTCHSGCYSPCTWLNECLWCAYHMMRCTSFLHIKRCSPDKLVHELGETLHSKIRRHDPILQGLTEFSQVSQSTWHMDNPTHITQNRFRHNQNTWTGWFYTGKL